MQLGRGPWNSSSKPSLLPALRTAFSRGSGAADPSSTFMVRNGDPKAAATQQLRPFARARRVAGCGGKAAWTLDVDRFSLLASRWPFDCSLQPRTFDPLSSLGIVPLARSSAKAGLAEGLPSRDCQFAGRAGSNRRALASCAAD